MPPIKIENSVFKLMFEHVKIGIVVVNELGKILLINSYASQIFQYSSEELLGEKIEVLIPLEYRKQHLQHRHSFKTSPKPRAMGLNIDLTGLKKNGQEFPVEVSLASYEFEGQNLVVSFVSDISARKKGEEELKKINEQLEEKVRERTLDLSNALVELNRINDSLNKEMEERKRVEEELRQLLEKEKELGELKSRFVAMASHEFRTPLAGILTSASLIERYGAQRDFEKCQKHLERIKTSVKNLNVLLNDFLSLEKLELGKIKAQPNDFDLILFFKDLIEEVQDLAKPGQKIILESEFKELEVFLDEMILHNVMLNLLSNAMKYSDENKPISIKLFHSTNAEIMIEVIDEGIGIPKEDLKHVFEKFFRAKNVTAVQGTGLGLNITRRYLKLMKGSIQCESIAGMGSTFRLCLPATLARTNVS